MNRLSNEDRQRVVSCLVEGNSIRATVRITGIAKKTVRIISAREANPNEKTIYAQQIKKSS